MADIADALGRRETMNALSQGELSWSYATPPPAHGFYLTSVFRDWHRAFLLGTRVDCCTFGGEILSGDQLARLNFWIEAHGAWRASALPYWEAYELLSRVVSGRTYKSKIGTAGGGRHAAGTQLEMLLWDAREGVESMPLLQIAKLGNE